MPERIDRQRETPSQANQTTRTTSDDRNSDLYRGDAAVLLPYNGLDRDGLFRAPIGFRRSEHDGGWDGRGVPPQTGTRGPVSGSDRRGSDRKARSLATDLVLDSIAKQRALTEDEAILDNSRNKPEYSLLVTYVVGAVIFVCMATGAALVFMGGR